MTSLEIRAVLYQKEGRWYAQCLEHDVTAVSGSLGGLHQELERVLIGHLVVAAETGTEPFTGLKPAPQRFYRMWEEAVTEARPLNNPLLSPPPGLSPPQILRRVAA